MKKIFLLLFAILFLNITSAQATSGACSYHSGVNCSAGADSDGSVICNDGWRDSSVSYFNASECASQKFYCTREEYDQIKERYNIDSLLNDLESANRAMEIKKAAYDNSRQDISGAALVYGSAARNTRLLAIETTGAANLVIAIQDNINQSLDLAEKECLTIGKDTYYQKILEALNNDIQKNENQNNILACPDNSYLNDKRCYCNNGYKAFENKCILEVKVEISNTENNLKNKNNSIISPLNLEPLLNSLNETRKTTEEDKYEKLIEVDLKDFKVGVSSEQKRGLINFAVYGISSATQILGSGERRALIRDYLDTVGKTEIYWEDIDNMANGQKIIARNLEKERNQAAIVLNTFKKIFGHNPDFSNYSEDLAWNTMMYRIRFPRDLSKEAYGVEDFKRRFKYSPSSPFDWAVVRVLGYVK